MFAKLLIANRGEIACRVIRTAQRLGIRTVAVYSEADARAPHVRLAEEAVCLGPAAAADSYLDVDAVLAAVRETGADAVHPGYGFLAENAAFAEALEAAGAAFIGPPAAAIRAMGDKIESKRIARAAGVATIPGHDAAVEDLDAALGAAAGLGYPVMLKASAGGGGKGMRRAADERSLREAFEGARGEARSSFGDDRLLVEKFIEQPRHIEIQILADRHGNMIHLGERECSIQRRHQKVIEEAPSPFLDAGTRAAMGGQALALARAVGYASAGTVEFVVDRDRNFYFLEMNTRLQVEHPVTEMITGLDLVELMIRIAAGEKLGLTQDQVAFDGWAVEARVYAEDPARGFLPSVGRLARYREPAAGPELRIDSGVVEGSEIDIHYDPMMAKVIAHGADRTAAIEALRAALDAFLIRGVRNNIGFLAALLGHPRFLAGRLTTAFIEEAYPGGFAAAPLDEALAARLAAVAAVAHGRVAEREAAIPGRLDGPAADAGGAWVVRLAGKAWLATVVPGEAGDRVTFEDDGEMLVASSWVPGEALFRAEVDGTPVTVQVDALGAARYRLGHAGHSRTAQVLPPHAARLAARMREKPPPDLSRYLLSPMPGLLLSVNVESGQEVKAGEVLAVVEAMKMENLLRAERDGVVATLHARAGDSVAVDQAILEFA